MRDSLYRLLRVPAPPSELLPPPKLKPRAPGARLPDADENQSYRSLVDAAGY